MRTPSLDFRGKTLANVFVGRGTCFAALLEARQGGSFPIW